VFPVAIPALKYSDELSLAMSLNSFLILFSLILDIESID
jgi:hypothetical protein